MHDDKPAGEHPTTPVGCCLPEDELSGSEDDEARSSASAAAPPFEGAGFLGELLVRLPARRVGAPDDGGEQVFGCE